MSEILYFDFVSNFAVFCFESENDISLDSSSFLLKFDICAPLCLNDESSWKERLESTAFGDIKFLNAWVV